MQTRAVDRATVRIVSLLGVNGEEAQGNLTHRPRLIAVPEVAHGSGLAVSGDGLILTARHVVSDGDVLAVLFPGEDHALAARVVAVDDAHDVAFLRVPGPTPEHLALPDRPRSLQTLERVSTSGYPLDPRERLPAAATGEVSRVNNDGRIQLAMAVNPGNSGGPVLDAEGRLVGVVSQGADPSHGAQGITLVEPIDSVLALHARLPTTTAPAGDPAAEQAVAQLVADIVRAGPWGLVFDETVNGRFAALAQGPMRPQVRVLMAAHLWNVMMLLVERERAADSGDLRGEAQARVHQIMGLMVTLCREAQAQDASIRAHYPFAHQVLSAIEVLEGHTCGGEGGACCNGARCSPGLACTASNVCVQPTPCANDAACGDPNQYCASGVCMARPTPSRFHFRLEAGANWDTAPQASTLGGGYGALGFTVNVADFGPAVARVSPLLGAQASFGAWRASFETELAAHVGIQGSFGGRSVRGVARLLYTPGFVYADARSSFAFVAYRAEALLQLSSFAFGLSWHEAQRGADSVFRMLGVVAEFGW